MSAFDDALAALHADPNLSVACTWSSGPGRTPALGPVVVSGIKGEAVDRAFGSGELGAMTGRRQVDIPVAALPAPVLRNDGIAIGAELFKVETAERDLEGITWRLTLAKA